MTFWLYNPGEPTGQPTQPAADLHADWIDGVTAHRGRCGWCNACPQVWRMVVPPGEPEGPFPPPGYRSWSEIYAGVYYFRRQPYAPRDGLKCEWVTQQTSFDRPFYFFDEHTPRSPAPDSKVTWQLQFVSYNNEYNWYLITPLERTVFDIPMISYYKFNGEARRFGCLHANTFTLQGEYGEVGGGLPFPYTPNQLTITPHPA